ncbi:ABC transporter ATP-binding protein [bacterium]|nr:ABC transporter ATP-binding protein [bacterium]
MNDNILEIKNLTQYFRNSGSSSPMLSFVPFIENVSFDVKKNEIFGIVGQSGSGKTTLGRCLIGLNTAVQGSIIYNGQNLISLNQKGDNPFRKKIQMIFQNPRSALNMNMTVYELILEAVSLIENEKKQIVERSDKLIKQFELTNIKGQFPYELSGGERRRVGIARVLALAPEVLIADEPVSSLDVSIKGMIIELLMKYREESGATVIFITHDIDLINRIADRVAVMYKGHLIEIFEPKNFDVNDKHHPYTRELYTAAEFFSNIDSKFNLEEENQEKIKRKFENKKISNSSCPYFGRCPLHEEKNISLKCIKETAIMKKYNNSIIACHAFE